MDRVVRCDSSGHSDVWTRRRMDPPTPGPTRRESPGTVGERSRESRRYRLKFVGKGLFREGLERSQVYGGSLPDVLWGRGLSLGSERYVQRNTWSPDRRRCEDHRPCDGPGRPTSHLETHYLVTLLYRSTGFHKRKSRHCPTETTPGSIDATTLRPDVVGPRTETKRITLIPCNR